MKYVTKEGGSVYAIKADFKEGRPLPLWIKHEIHHGRLSRTDNGKGEQYFTIYNEGDEKIRVYKGAWLVKNKSNRIMGVMNDDFKSTFDAEK